MSVNIRQIFLAKGNVPAPSYNLFMDKLLETIRGEIGTCLERAYHKISLSGAARMLYSDPAQMQEYANQVSGCGDFFEVCSLHMFQGI